MTRNKFKKKDNSNFELTVDDWKTVEQTALSEIQNAKKAIVIQEIMLSNAQMFIRQLGGETLEDTFERSKKEDEARRKNTIPN